MITALSISRGGLGRFGNQMFTIAGAIGIAVRSGQPFAFPRWRTLDNAIFGEKIDDIQEQLANPLPEIPEGLEFQEYGYFWGYRDVYLPTGNWSIDAHMQSEKFFKHCIDLVRHHFIFKNEYPQNDYVAIHYRAGDYQQGDNVHHPRCTKEYYQNAIAQFPSGTKFKIFSDNTDEAYSLMQEYSNEMEISVTNNYIKDFKMMKACKSFITANSSFSAMAAILGTHPEKRIIMPERWFGKAMPPEFDKKDVYVEEALIL